MHRLRFTVVSTLLTLCAGCAVSPPPAQTPRTISDSQRPRTLTRLGDDMRRNGDAAGAIGLYRAASQAAPNDPVVLGHMGDAFMDMNDPARAEQAFRGELAVQPSNRAAERGLALSLLAQNQPAEALSILQRLAGDSSDPGLLRAEGTALDMVGRSAEAQAVYRRGLKSAPIDANLHGNLALSLALGGDATGAVTEMQAAVASPNPDPRQDANAVLVLALTGNTAAARARGNATVGAAATETLLARAQQASSAGDARSRAIAVGVLTSTAPGAPPSGSTLLPPITAAPVAITAPPPAADPSTRLVSSQNLPNQFLPSSQTGPTTPTNPQPALR
jgi:Flp pilus assembly protein TadD